MPHLNIGRYKFRIWMQDHVENVAESGKDVLKRKVGSMKKMAYETIGKDVLKCR